jgi:(4S)-4-hydroxy-5-phosphonooxypentane-2,3-dione isomerase
VTSRHNHRPAQPRFLRYLFGLAVLLAIDANGAAQAQPDSGTIYGVMALDVAPGAANEGATLLKQYRDGALKQPGNMGVTLLQELEWPNRFIVYETWRDQAAFDASEKAAPTAELASKLKSMNAAPFDRRDYQVISVGPARPPAAGDVIYMQLHLDVFPPGIDPTVAAAKVVAEAARKGEGNLRYDVVKSVKAPLSHMTLIGAWQSRKAFDAYEDSAYARQFRDVVGPLLGSPYDDRLYVPIN